MAITYNAHNSSSVNGGVSISHSHAAAAGSRVIGVVGVFGDNIVAPTWGGVTMTQIGTTLVNGSGHQALFYRALGESPGTQTVTFNNGNADLKLMGSMTFNGVDQSSPVRTKVQAEGNGTSATTTAASALADDMVFDFLFIRGSVTLTAGAGQTKRVDHPEGAARQIAMSHELATGSTVMSWSLSPADDWAIMAVPLVPGESTIAPAGIPSAEAVGTPSLPQVTKPPSIPSEEEFGTATVLVGDPEFYPIGIETREEFGTPELVVLTPPDSTADRFRIGHFTLGGKFVVDLDLENGFSYRKRRDSFTITPGPRKAVRSPGVGRYGGTVQVGETHEDATVGATWLIKGSGNVTSMLDRLAKFVEQIEDGTNGQYIEWRAGNATSSVYFARRGPGQWSPEYRWVQAQGAQSLEVQGSFPVAPLADGAPLDIDDRFTVDTITDYAWSPPPDAWTTALGYLQPPSSGNWLLTHTERGYSYTDVQATLKFRTGAVTTGKQGVRLKIIDHLTYLFAYVDGTNLKIATVDQGGIETVLQSTALGLSAGTSYWVRGRTEGNVFYGEAFTGEPTPLGTPAATVSHTLTGLALTQFGSSERGPVGLVLQPGDATYRYERFEVRPYTYRNRTLPQKITMSGDIPGSAPAEAEVSITTSGGTEAPAWALASLWQRPLSVTAPFGIVYGKDGLSPSGWTVQDGTAVGALGGNYLRGTAGVAAVTMSAAWTVSPNDFPDPDAFRINELSVEVWGRVRIAKENLPVIATLFSTPALGENFGSRRYTNEYGVGGKVLTPPFAAGEAWRFVKLGTLGFSTFNGATNEWKINLSLLTTAGGTLGVGLDYLVMVPARARILSPSGKALNDAYPKFIPSTSQTSKRVLPDLRGLISSPPNDPHPHHGLGGEPLAPQPGPHDLLIKLSSTVPDDPTGNSLTEVGTHAATVQVRIKPRYFIARGLS